MESYDRRAINLGLTEEEYDFINGNRLDINMSNLIANDKKIPDMIYYAVHLDKPEPFADKVKETKIS